jgi:hypothetical protein
MSDPRRLTDTEESPVSDRLVFTTADGTTVQCDIEPEPDDSPLPGVALRSRHVVLRSSTEPAVAPVGSRFLQKRVSYRSGGDWRVDDLLDNEIGAGLRLIRRYGGPSYPVELSRLVGYDLDSDEPYVLLAPYGGEPVDRCSVPLTLEHEIEFQIGLARALLLLAAAGLVHGRITPETVRWDRRSAQVEVVDFTSAQLVGEPRPAGGESPWCPPEHRNRTAAADARGDVWSAGMLIYHMATGRAAPGGAGGPDLSTRGPALRSLLDGVFAAEPDARPDARQLLDRLRVVDLPPSVPTAADPRFEEGRRLFAELSRSKHPPAADEPSPPRPATAISRPTSLRPTPVRPSSQRHGLPVVLVLVALAVVALAVVVMVAL